MKKIAIFFFSGFALVSSAQVLYQSQEVSLNDIYHQIGWQMGNKSMASLKGTPMFRDDWTNGSVIFSNGRTMHKALLHYNLVNHQLYYRLEEHDFIFVDPIKEFRLLVNNQTDSSELIFRNGYRVNPSIFFELLADGPVYQLLKFPEKVLREYYEYGSPITREFQLVATYYIYNKTTDSMLNIPLKHTIEDLLPQKAVAIRKLTGIPSFRFRTEKELAGLLLRLE